MVAVGKTISKSYQSVRVDVSLTEDVPTGTTVEAHAKVITGRLITMAADTIKSLKAKGW